MRKPDNNVKAGKEETKQRPDVYGRCFVAEKEKSNKYLIFLQECCIIISNIPPEEKKNG
ncbi:MAG: hypothetical protein IJT87_11440 [Ruminiclostridium sp.]|nr:hypothetical protein [Ruminiclostridium sp.]